MFPCDPTSWCRGGGVGGWRPRGGRGRGTHPQGRWPDFLPTGSRAAQLGSPVLTGSEVWGGGLIGTDPLPSLWCSTSGHFYFCLASKRNFLMRSVQRYSLPKEFGGRGITALLGSFCLYSMRGSPLCAEPSNRPTGSQNDAKFLPQKMCETNSSVG